MSQAVVEFEEPCRRLQLFPMVANFKPADEHFVALPSALVQDRSCFFHFSQKDLETFARLGTIPEDGSTELLNGLIFHTDRSAVGEEVLRIGRSHRVMVERLSDLRARINNGNRHVESQQTLNCGEFEEPQPDFMVVRGTKDDIGEDGPAAADAFCVLEVADSSYERDTGVKRQIYARAGVRQYIVINLRNRTAEVYTQPDQVADTYSPPRGINSDGGCRGF